MKQLTIISLVLLSFQLMAQDTIVHQSGKVEAVRIISLNTNSKLMVYTVANDTVYTSTNNLERYMLHSELRKNLVYVSSGDQIDNSQEKFFERNKKRIPRFDYSKYSISTNLLASIPIYPTNSRLTIEPEYQLNKNFSIKVPLVIGLKQYQKIGVSTKHPYGRNSALFTYGIDDKTDYFANPDLTIQYMGDRLRQENIAFQVGLNPKYFPFSKSKKLLSLYIGASINMGIADRNRWDFYHSIDTSGYNGYNPNGPDPWVTVWRVQTPQIEISKNPFFFFNYEFQIGLEHTIGKRINLGYELAYSSKLIGKGKLNDRVFEKRFNGDYEVVLEDEIRFKGTSDIPIRCRIFLTYRFGGKIRE